MSLSRDPCLRHQGHPQHYQRQLCQHNSVLHNTSWTRGGTQSTTRHGALGEPLTSSCASIRSPHRGQLRALICRTNTTAAWPHLGAVTRASPRSRQSRTSGKLTRPAPTLSATNSEAPTDCTPTPSARNSSSLPVE